MSERADRIEAVLSTHDEVAEVVAIDITEGSRSGRACFVTRVHQRARDPDRPRHLSSDEAGDALDRALVAELRDFLSRALPAQAVPLYIRILDEIPLGSDGLPDKAELARRVHTGVSPEADVPHAHGEAVSVAALLQIWHDVLARSDFGEEAQFLALGGGSLAAMRIVSRVREQFDVRVPLSILFSDHTVRHMATYINSVIASRQ